MTSQHPLQQFGPRGAMDYDVVIVGSEFGSAACCFQRPLPLLAPARVASNAFALTALRAALCCGPGQMSHARARNASARKSINARTLGGRCLRLA